MYLRRGVNDSGATSTKQQHIPDPSVETRYCGVQWSSDSSHSVNEKESTSHELEKRHWLLDGKK